MNAFFVIFSKGIDGDRFAKKGEESRDGGEGLKLASERASEDATGTQRPPTKDHLSLVSHFDQNLLFFLKGPVRIYIMGRGKGGREGAGECIKSNQ